MSGSTNCVTVFHSYPNQYQAPPASELPGPVPTIGLSQESAEQVKHMCAHPKILCLD